MNWEISEIIDLTHLVDEDIPTWSGGKGFSKKVILDYHKGCRVMSYSMLAGLGTHVDAPLHMIAGGGGVETIPVEKLIAPLKIIDVSSFVGSRSDVAIDIDCLSDYEKSFGEIPHGCFIAFFTGWSNRLNKKTYRQVNSEGRLLFPYLSPSVLPWLLEKAPVGVGLDSLSPDPDPLDRRVDGSNKVSVPEQLFPVHVGLLSQGIYILEGIANLDKVLQKEWMVVVAPLKIKDGSEAAARVMAFR